MSGRIVTHLAGADKPPGSRQPMLTAFLSQQVDACLWLSETAADPVVKSFARIALRRLEALIPTSEPAP